MGQLLRPAFGRSRGTPAAVKRLAHWLLGANIDFPGLGEVSTVPDWKLHIVERMSDSGEAVVYYYVWSAWRSVGEKKPSFVGTKEETIQYLKKSDWPIDALDWAVFQEKVLSLAKAKNNSTTGTTDTVPLD